MSEFAGILKGGPNPEGAAKLIDFLTRQDVQEELPLNMFVFPGQHQGGAAETVRGLCRQAGIAVDTVAGRDRNEPRRLDRRVDEGRSVELVVDRSPAGVGGPVNPLRRAALVIGLAATAGLALLYAYPVVRVLVEGFRWGAISDVVTDSRLWGVGWFSLWQAALSTVGVLAIAVPLAFVLARRQVVGRRFMLAAIAAPFTLPTVVVAAALREALPSRFDTGVVAIISAHMFYNIGAATLIVLPRFESVDHALVDAARTLGASRRRTFRTVELPLAASAIRSAALLVFTLCFTSFGVVIMLGGSRRTTIDVEIYRQALQRLRLDRASVLAIMQLVVLAALAFAATRSRGASGSNRPKRSALGGADRRTSAALIAIVGVLLIPLSFLVRRSLREPSGGFGFANFRALTRVTRGSGLLDPAMRSFVVSARTALLAASLALVIGGALAVASHETGRIASAFRVIGSLPLATSSVQLGLGFLLAFAAAPLAWRSRWFAVPLVQAVIAVPFVIRQLSPSLDAVPRDLRRAAMTLGASPWRAWASIDARLVRQAWASAFAIALAVALGEFGAATFLARPDAATVPVAIARLSGHPGAVLQGQAAALSVLLGALTLTVVLIGRLAGGTRPGLGDSRA